MASPGSPLPCGSSPSTFTSGFPLSTWPDKQTKNFNASSTVIFKHCIESGSRPGKGKHGDCRRLVGRYLPMRSLAVFRIRLCFVRIEIRNQHFDAMRIWIQVFGGFEETISKGKNRCKDPSFTLKSLTYFKF